MLEQSADGKQLLTESNMTLRIEEHDKGLQRMIDMVSKKCGLGAGRYRFESGVVKTAREVVAENSDLYQSIIRPSPGASPGAGYAGPVASAGSR